MFSQKGIRIIRISDFDENGINNKEIKRYPYSKELDQYKIINNDILLCMTGGTVGKCAIVNSLVEDSYINQRIALIRFHSININYGYLVLKSAYVSNLIKSSKTSTNDNISMKLIENILLPLPPLSEQQRIMKRIEQIEPLLQQYDKLEKQLTKLENEITDKLKKSILQYAIEGKLVKQDPNDEPASVLLERIKAEKEKLIKEGKIKRDKNESYIYQGDDKNYYEKINGKISNITEEIPFNIPNNWCWTRLPNVIYYYLGKTPDRHNKMFWENGTYNWISISDMKDREIILNTNEKITDLALKSCFNNKISPAGTLIMSFKLTVGRVSILGIDSVHNEAIVSIFPFIDLNKITRNFLMYSLGSLIQYCKATDAIKGATLNKEKINRLLIPFPPLNEQHKICIKIESLFDNIK